MKRVLVTGAGGYIGRHVVDALIGRGTEVLAVDINTDGINPRAKIFNCNIFSGDKNIFTELGSPDVCLHMAWKDGFIHNSDAHMKSLSSHYEFVSNMLEGGLKHLAVMGTMHEIGYYEGAIDENTPCNPTSMYGIAKDSLRRALMLLAHDKGIVLQWLRAYYIYGDDKKNNSVFAKIILAEEAEKETFPFVSGKNKYDFIEVSELANQIAACTTQDNINGIINCCTGVPMSLADKAEEFIKKNNFKIKLQYGAFPDRPYDSPGVWGNATKIQTVMTHELEKNLKNGE
ncbi:MAG: NAD(P)-dependent oxidoreductase [Hydrogenoanaerobacterium sp.]